MLWTLRLRDGEREESTREGSGRSDYLCILRVTGHIPRNFECLTCRVFIGCFQVRLA